MKTFGIISEGPTDQIVIENILFGFFNEDDNLDVRFLQPIRDATDEQETNKFGGWYKVFEYCRSKNFIEAFEQNDYLVVQIDTDRSEEPQYDVKKTNANGNRLTTAELVEAVIAKFETILTQTFGSEKYALFSNNIIYAVCVDEIECWLLPLYHNDKTKASTNNCTHKLNKKIYEQLGFFIDASNKSNMVGHYHKMSKPYLKPKVLQQKEGDNSSLSIFIQMLAAKNIIISA
jgi:hypothetical protein